MINFKVKILKYTKETKSFSVEYTPEESMVPPCTVVRQTFVLNELNADSTEEQIYKVFTDLAPQQQWQFEIDAANIPNTSIDRFESLIDVERSFNVEDLIVPNSNPNIPDGTTLENLQEFKDIEMEAAIQRVLSKLSKEQV